MSKRFFKLSELDLIYCHLRRVSKRSGAGSIKHLPAVINTEVV
jgi:hypothetical protein